MTEEPLPADGWHPPYEARNQIVCGVMLFAAACLIGYSVAERSQWAAYTGGSAALLGVIVIAATIVAVKSDRCRREIATKVEQATTKREEMRMELRDLTNTVSANSGELEALKALLGDFIKRYPPYVAAGGEAEADGANVVGFPSAPSKVYQLGLAEGMRRARDPDKS